MSDVKLDRAALREIAERLKTESAYPSPSPRWYEDVQQIADYVLALTAPLLVKCGECGGKGYIPDPWPESKTGWDCPACHGKGSVERADLAAIRKRLEDASHAAGCRIIGNADPPHAGVWEYNIELRAEDCNCWKSTFGLYALLDLIAAQAREIAELKEKAND